MRACRDSIHSKYAWHVPSCTAGTYREKYIIKTFLDEVPQNHFPIKIYSDPLKKCWVQVSSSWSWQTTSSNKFKQTLECSRSHSNVFLWQRHGINLILCSGKILSQLQAKDMSNTHTPLGPYVFGHGRFLLFASVHITMDFIIRQSRCDSSAHFQFWFKGFNKKYYYYSHFHTWLTTLKGSNYLSYKQCHNQVSPFPMLYISDKLSR